MNNPSSLLFAITAATALFVVPSFADGEEVWQSRPVVQDTFVRDTETDTNFGSSTGVVAGNNREGLMMFDVSGLANITAAKIKFYITQCGTTEGVNGRSQVAALFPRHAQRPLERIDGHVEHAPRRVPRPCSHSCDE